MFLRVFYFDVVVFSLVFSLLFCFLCCVVDSLFGFWVFLELCGLAVVPSFFLGFGLNFYNLYGSVLSYIIMSGLSSVLLVSGLLINGLYYFVFFGFVVKFGLFPFMLWVYRVFSVGSWVFIFLLSVVMKFPVLFFCFLYQISGFDLVFVDCGLTIFVCSCLVWFFSLSWEYIWCHISLSSVATLVVACFCSGTDICFFIYWYYSFWALCSIIYFVVISDSTDLKGYYFWLFCFLLLITPVSMPLVYKLSVCIGIFYSSIYVLLSWVVYSFSEQFFLFKLGGDYFYSNVFNYWVE
uniref:NADH dehydrogenase subunit 2 n=1 Tax=Echinococcus granulosus sensu lato genotype G6 TaxID=2212968 RepID=A0A2Z4GR85_9CEST|nr:NADH dehydrogenase subunit 2 [Echinococcus granulosus sensu lato genotype G6]